MAALLEFTDQTTNLSTFHLPEFYSGGQPELDVVYDYAVGGKGQLFDDSCFTFDCKAEAAVVSAGKGGCGGGGCGGGERRCGEGVGEVKRRKVEAEFRIGFRTKSEVEILDDGFKWRKYGKKAVKNSPNPRNYYRCASSGCGVKKRVERDRNDQRYVITTYEGTHNHGSPAAAPHPFLTYELANSSSWSSCAQMMPTIATDFTWTSQFTPSSYT